MEQRVFGGTAEVAETTKRPVAESMKRGFLCHCPNCGKGKIFRAFLKVADSCNVCSEEFSHHRADDLPAYLVIAIVGHITVAGTMGSERLTSWSPWEILALWVPLTIIMALALLNPIKGAVVGLQWALRMHGFGGHKDELGQAYGDQ